MDRIKKLFLLSFLAKVLLCLFLPVTLDEYYYFLWGQFPSWSYFDHPPMTGWLMLLSQHFKSFGEGAIRLPFVLLSHLSIGLWLSMLRKPLGEKRLYLFLWVALLNPLWGLGGLIATPDIPLVFFWSLSLFFGQRVLERNQWRDFLGLGFSLGFAFLSKYQIVIIIPCFVLLLIQQKKWNRLLSFKGLATVLIGLIACSPVLIWNMQHEWASFSFQWKHGMSASHWKWYWPLEYIGTQVLIIFPSFLLFIFYRWPSLLKHWLSPFAFFPFLFFLYSSFKGRVEGNWVIMGLPSLYALSLVLTPEPLLHWLRKTLYFWGLTLLTALLIFPFTHKNKLVDSKRYASILESIDKEQTYLSSSYQMSGFLSFKLDKIVCKLPKYGRMDHMDFLSLCQTLPPHFFYISEHAHSPKIEKDFPGFQVVSEKSIDSTYKFIEVRKK